MDYYHRYRQKQRNLIRQKPNRIYERHRYIREKVLIRFPIVYSLLIEDNYSGIMRDKTDFIIQAVEEKFQRDKINFEPKEPIDQEAWENEVKEWEKIIDPLEDVCTL